MSRKNTRSDLITGAFAVIVVGAFLATVLFLQGWSPTPKGNRYSVRFANSGGLTVNAPVIVAGQRVGKVETIDPTPVVDADSTRRVEVVVGFLVDEKFAGVVALPSDTVAVVQSGGLFGGAQLALELGKSSRLLAAGERLPLEGRPPVELADLLKVADETVRELQSGFQNVAEILKDPTLKDNLQVSLASLRSALETFDAGLKEMQPAFAKVGPAVESTQLLVEDLRKLIAQNNDNISRTLANLESASGRLDKLLAEDADGVPRLVSNLNTIADSLDVLVTNLNDLVIDNQVNVKVSLENIRETTDSLRVFAKRIENDPSLLVWGGNEQENPALDQPRPVPNVDELSIRNSGRRPRKESD